MDTHVICSHLIFADGDESGRVPRTFPLPSSFSFLLKPDPSGEDVIVEAIWLNLAPVSDSGDIQWRHKVLFSSLSNCAAKEATQKNWTKAVVALGGG